MISATKRVLGGYVEPALWVLIALDEDPLGVMGMFDSVRALDGPIGHGTLLAAVSRLERLGLIDSAVNDAGSRVYRLTILGQAGAGAASMLRGRPA